MMVELCKQFKMNGVVEATNKNIKKIVQKIIVTYKDWHDMLSYALHRYRTLVQASTGTTPYSLVYGIEVVFPMEVEIPSLCVNNDADAVDTSLPCVTDSLPRLHETKFKPQQSFEVHNVRVWKSTSSRSAKDPARIPSRESPSSKIKKRKYL
ncbi:hypothetical protein CR513_33941, partial [Mucuna pruriens]